MQIHVLNISFNFNGNEQAIHPVIIENESELIVVDCGYAGFMPLIENAASTHGLSLDDLTGIIITHHDMDHMGGLFEIKQKYPAVKVYASELDAPYVSGAQKSLRLQQAETLFGSLPEEQKPGAMHFQEFLKSVKPVAVDATFSDNEVPPFLQGIKIIFTPGHMPGHISLYAEGLKTLIAADAVVYENGALEIANPEYTLDLEAAVQSVKRLRQLELERLICYHGGEVTSGINELLDALIQKYSPA